MAALQRTLEATTAHVEQLQQQNTSLEQVCTTNTNVHRTTRPTQQQPLLQDKLSLHTQLKDTQHSLHVAQLATQSIEEQHQQLHVRFDAQAAAHEQVKAESGRLLTELTELQDNCTQLLGELERQQAKCAQLSAQLTESTTVHSNASAQWDIERAALEVRAAMLTEREEALQSEKAQLKGAVGTALQQQEALQQQLGDLVAQAEGLEAQVGSLTSETERLQGVNRDLENSLSTARQDAQGVREAHARLQDEATATAAKLAHLEGELGALQDVIGAGDQRNVVQALVSKVATLEHALAEAELARRKLHNQLVELRGNVCCGFVHAMCLVAIPLKHNTLSLTRFVCFAAFVRAPMHIPQSPVPPMVFPSNSPQTTAATIPLALIACLAPLPHKSLCLERCLTWCRVHWMATRCACSVTGRPAQARPTPCRAHGVRLGRASFPGQCERFFRAWQRCVSKDGSMSCRHPL